MKKLTLFLLLAFFAGVTQSFATQYCGEELTSNVGWTGKYLFSAEKLGEKQVKFTISAIGNETISGFYQMQLRDLGGGTINKTTWDPGDNDFSDQTKFSVTQDGKAATILTTWSYYPTSNLRIYLVMRRNGAPDIFGQEISNIDVSASCSAGPVDDEAPTMTSASLVSKTYNSVILSVSGTDNVAVTKYVVKNGSTELGSYTPTESKITITGLTPNTAYTLNVYAKDAAGNVSSNYETVNVTTDAFVYYQFPIGHLNTPDFGDINGRALLTIKKVSDSKIGIRLQHNGGTAAVKYINAIVNGFEHKFGTESGDAADLEDYVYIDGLSSLTSFTLNLVWFCNTANWNWANGGSFTIKEDELYEEQSSLLDPKLTITDPSTAAIELAIDATKLITWTSSNTATPTFTSSKESVATVSADGLITAKAIGSATITVKQDETDTYQEATQTITVTVPGDKSKNTECKGWDNEKSQEDDFVLGYNYEFKTENGDVIVKFEFFDEDINGAYLWDYTTGEFSEKSVTYNNRVVTYTYSQPTTETVKFAIKVTRTVGMSATKQFTYHVGEDCQEHPVTGVSITSTFTQLEVGQSMTMTAAVTPANATNKNVIWSITSGSDKATINSSGTLTAGDAEGSVTVQVETEEGGYTATKTITVIAAKPTAPSAAPADPTLPAEQVKAVYSATYDADCNFGNWGGGTGNDKLTYGWKFYNNNYFGLVDFTHNCSQMETLHIDIWVAEDFNGMRIAPINGGKPEQLKTLTLEGQKWNSIDVPMTEFANDKDFSNVYQIKFDGLSGKTFWVNNVYFYTTQEKTTCALSASVKNNEGGTASVDNADVTKGGSATFTAVADCGYSFVGWWNNTTKVSENTTYAPTDIQEDLSLVAEFAFVGPSEAANVKTYDQMISIYGVGTPITGVTMNPYWEDATQKTEISVAGKQMWKYSTINYFGIDFDGNRQDVSAMKYIHLDIWPNASGKINFSLIWNGGESPVTIQLVGGQWNSINIPLTNWSTENLKTIRQLKLDAQTSTVGEGAIDGATILVQDIFFYAPNEFTLSEEDDNAENLTAFNGKVCSVTIDRAFDADGANYTLCLPFAMTEEQCLAAFGDGYKLFLMGTPYMKTTDMMYLPFSEVTSIEAGKPYLFCPAVDIENPIIVEEVTIDAETSTTIGNDVAKMTGIYSPYNLPEENNYILGDDNWLYLSDGTQMYGLRCYFTLTPSAAPVGVRARAVFHNTDVVTDLETIDGAQSMPNGKYVINGQFVIIRNNVRYNGIGQQVK